jgi:hypothetical protein
MHGAKPGALADRSDPAARGAPIQALAVASAEDWAFVAFANGEVDGAGGTRDERNRCRLVALADDAQGAVPPFEAEFLDVGGAGFAHSQSVQTDQHGERRVISVELLRGEEEHTEFGTVQAAGFSGMDLWPTDVLRRVRADATVDVCEAIEPTDRRQSTIDRRRGQTPALHPGAEELDVRPLRFEHDDTVVGRPLEEPPQVMAVSVESATAVPGQERGSGELGFVRQQLRRVGLDLWISALDRGHG